MREKDLDNIEQALYKAHLQRPDCTLDEAWEAGVMRRIRCEALTSATTLYSQTIQRCIWRFAAASCALALVLTTWTFVTGLQVDQLILMMIENDPLSFQLLRLLAI